MEILINAIIKAAGWSIINSLWQGAILYSILLVIFILNPKLPAKSRHNLSFLALCGMFIWFIMTFYNEFATWFYIGKSIELIGVYPVGTMYVNHNIIALPASLVFRAEQSIPMIVSIYSLGLMLQIVWLLFGYYRLWQIKTKGLTKLPAELEERFTNIISKFQIKRKIRFSLSSKVSVPLVIGYFKPIVLLPFSILAQMNPEQLEAIIIHELWHIRRNDYLLNLLKITIETILFFNPFIWLSARLIDTERENACDDLVLKVTGNPLTYAQTLLQLEEIKAGQQVFSMAFTGKKYHLLTRIKRITNMKTSNLNMKLQLFGILLLVTVVLSLAWIPANKNEVSHAVNDAAKVLKSKINNMINEHEILIGKKSNAAPVQLPEPGIKVVNLRIEAKEIGSTDTLPKPKGKFKIVVEDENGNKKEYNSLNELPAEMRTDFLKENRTGIYPTQLYYDLLKKMDGVTVEKDGKVMVDGKPIKMVKVDGKEVKDEAITISGKPVNITKVRVDGEEFFDGRTLQNDVSPEEIDKIKRIKGVEIDKNGNITSDGHPATLMRINGKAVVYVPAFDASEDNSALTKPQTSISDDEYNKRIQSLIEKTYEKGSKEYERQMSGFINQLKIEKQRQATSQTGVAVSVVSHDERRVQTEKELEMNKKIEELNNKIDEIMNQLKSPSKK